MPVAIPQQGFQQQLTPEHRSTRPQLPRSLPLHSICPEAPPPRGKVLEQMTGQHPLASLFHQKWSRSV